MIGLIICKGGQVNQLRSVQTKNGYCKGIRKLRDRQAPSIPGPPIIATYDGPDGRMPLMNNPHSL